MVGVQLEPGRDGLHTRTLSFTAVIAICLIRETFSILGNFNKNAKIFRFVRRRTDAEMY